MKTGIADTMYDIVDCNTMCMIYMILDNEIVSQQTNIILYIFI